LTLDALGTQKIKTQCLRLNAIKVETSTGDQTVTSSSSGWLGGIQLPAPLPATYKGCSK
jgi:hypothetical protein